ncbi:hypothetical protein Hanom_Chr06g00480691 [Helianthus anomalus]
MIEGVWDSVSKWCGIPNCFAFSLKDVMELHKVHGMSTLHKEIVRGVVIVCCWRLWKLEMNRYLRTKWSKSWR